MTGIQENEERIFSELEEKTIDPLCWLSKLFLFLWTQRKNRDNKATEVQLIKPNSVFVFLLRIKRFFTIDIAVGDKATDYKMLATVVEGDQMAPFLIAST